MNQLDNNASVRAILAALRDGLCLFVLKTYKQRYSGESYLQHLQDVLQSDHPFDDEVDAKQSVDLQGWLKAMQGNWDEVFSKKIGHRARQAKTNIDVASARNYLYEVQNVRNNFLAHEAAGTTITDHDVYRLADTAIRLLRVIKAGNEADAVEEIKLKFGCRLYSTEIETSDPEPAPEQLHPHQTDDSTNEEIVDSEGDEIEVRVDLSGLDLSGQDLNGRNLHLADLRGANLAGSNLRLVILKNCDLSHAKLMRVDLSGHDLGNCNLSDANLSEARLDWANLQNAKFLRADLTLTDLSDSKLGYADFSHADLTDANLSNSEERVRVSLISEIWPGIDAWDEVYCLGANFRNAILIKANLRRTLFELVDFRDANLTAANLIGARFSGNFTGAILRDADFSHCELLTCDFTGARMERVNLSNVSYCVHCIFSNADMSSANLANLYIDEGNIDEEYHWHNVNLSGANLTGANLPRQSFRNANLTGAVFRNANLSHSDLSHADLMDTDFTEADLTEVNFDGAKFRYTTILPDGSYWTEDTNMTRFTGIATDGS